MQRLRSTWLALVGGALLVALSVSAAFGAPPTGEDGPRGQTVAAFVHELVFGSDEQTDEEEVINEDNTGGDEESSDEQLVEEELEDEQLEDELEGEFANHGECVSEEASDKTDEDREVDGNHGAVVSFAAQVTCADLLEVIEEDETEHVVDEEEREVPEGFANHGECVSTAAREGAPEESNYLTHGKSVSENARYTCWGLEPPTGEEAGLEETSDSTVEEEEGGTEELSAKEQRKADEAAARDARKAERETAKPAKASNRGNGGGNGRGGGRP